MEHVSKMFGTLEAVKDASLTVRQGEVVLIIGPSGSGKSTLLRSVNKLEKVTSGKIWIDEDEVTSLLSIFERSVKRQGWCFRTSICSPISVYSITSRSLPVL